jgi:hypothetical protein
MILAGESHVHNQRMKILYLCNAVHAQETVLKDLQGQEDLSFDFVMADTPQIFKGSYIRVNLTLDW